MTFAEKKAIADAIKLCKELSEKFDLLVERVAQLELKRGPGRPKNAS